MSYQNKKSKKWLARIKIDGKIKHVGSFDNKEEADKAQRVARENNPIVRSIRKDNKSGHTGVVWNKKARKWHAFFKGHSLGYFYTKNAAVSAREEAEDVGT